jgi:hypothetical protein
MADEEKTEEQNAVDSAKQVLSQGLFIIIMFLVAIVLFYIISTKP